MCGVCLFVCLFVPPRPQLSVKGFPKKSDGSKGTAERDGRIEKGDFLLAVNSIRLEGLGFNDAIRVLTTQVGVGFTGGT